MALMRSPGVSSEAVSTTACGPCVLRASRWPRRPRGDSLSLSLRGVLTAGRRPSRLRPCWRMEDAFSLSGSRTPAPCGSLVRPASPSMGRAGFPRAIVAARGGDPELRAPRHPRAPRSQARGRPFRPAPPRLTPRSSWNLSASFLQLFSENPSRFNGGSFFTKAERFFFWNKLPFY